MTKSYIKFSKRNNSFYFRCAYCSKKIEGITKEELENYPNYKFYGYTHQFDESKTRNCADLIDGLVWDRLRELNWYGVGE